MIFHIQNTNTVRTQKGQPLTSQRPTRKMRGTVFLFLGVVIGINISSSKAYRICYNCVGAASPADCDRIIRCGVHEECFEEQVVSSHVVLYNSGCRSTLACQTSKEIQNGNRSNVVSCSKCCDGDFCNIGLCGGGQHTSTALRCFNCLDYATTIHHNDCDHITQCTEDEMCYARKVLNVVDIEPHYETGCRPRLQCKAIEHAAVINQCFECCDTPMCNMYKCGLNWTAVYRTSPQPTFTEATITPRRTVKLDQPVISGDTSLAYHDHGRLNCTSKAENVTFEWKLNGNPFRSEHDAVFYIFYMTESNVGTYTCVVSKDGETAEASINVTIKEAGAVLHSCSSWPRPAQSGKELHISCEVTGYPVPDVHWTFINSLGQNFVPEEVIYPLKGTAIVQFFRPASHSGNWTCVATNKIGTDTFGIVVN